MSPAGLKAGRSGVEQTTCNREITASSHMVAIATTYIETSKSWWGEGKFQGNNPFFNNVITIHGWSKELIQVTRVYSLGNWKTLLVITPNSNTFSDWKKTCTCRGSKHSNSRGKQQLELSTRTWPGRAPWNRGKLVRQPAWSKRFLRSFFNFWVGRYKKSLNDWPRGKQWVFFPQPHWDHESLGETKLTVSLQASH